MRIAICDDDERELRHLSELLTEYQLDRRGSIDWRTYCNGTDFCARCGAESTILFYWTYLCRESTDYRLHGN